MYGVPGCSLCVCVCLGLVRQELGSCSEICAVCVSLCVLYLQDGYNFHMFLFPVCVYMWCRKHMCTAAGFVSSQSLGECDLCGQSRVCVWPVLWADSHGISLHSALA